MPDEETKTQENQAKCANCGTEVGYLATAGVAIQFSGRFFCCEGCLEEWLDKQQG